MAPCRLFDDVFLWAILVAAISSNAFNGSHLSTAVVNGYKAINVTHAGMPGLAKKNAKIIAVRTKRRVDSAEVRFSVEKDFMFMSPSVKGLWLYKFRIKHITRTCI